MRTEDSVALETWSAWHPAELARRIGSVPRPWCVVGGWALDLWHGHQTRDHEDLEFTVLRGDLALFRRALAGMRFYTAGDGIVEHLPDGREPPDGIFQIWCRDETAQCWRVDMMIEPGTPLTWVYKRDPGISKPRAEMIGMTGDGLPYLKPAAVLLFKAKYQRDKDEADFRNALPKLEAAERQWLKDCLDAAHPGHDWLLSL